MECIICGKEFEDSVAVREHMLSEHGREAVVETVLSMLQMEYPDARRGYWSYLVKSDICIPSLELSIEVMPESIICRGMAQEFKKRYLEIWCIKDIEDLKNQVRRAVYGLDARSVYSDEECRREITVINNSPGKASLRSTSNRCIYRFQPVFYERENALWLSDLTKRRYLIENRMQYLFKDEWEITDREFLSGGKISGLCKGYSHFNPLLLKWICENYFYGAGTDLYLPCCGWGHKLLVAGNVRSIYAIDNNEKIIEGLKDIAEFMNTGNVTIEKGDASEIAYHGSNCTFVCPPYYNTEIYKNKYTNYEEYREFVLKMLRKSFDESSSDRLGIVIDNKNTDTIRDMYPNAKVFDLKNFNNHFTPKKYNTEVFIYVEK